MSTVVNVRVDEKTKRRAKKIVESLGINLSQAINLYLKQIIYTGSIPFEPRLPSRETLKAINELESGEGSKFKSVDELFQELED